MYIHLAHAWHMLILSVAVFSMTLMLRMCFRVRNVLLSICAHVNFRYMIYASCSYSYICLVYIACAASTCQTQSSMYALLMSHAQHILVLGMTVLILVLRIYS
jgi:hypothetical protein